MAKVATKNLLLMRSGQTDWDAAGRVQGSTDLPLCEVGRSVVMAEVGTLGVKGLGGRDLSIVLSAPDEGSRETARLLAQARGAKVVVVPEFADPKLGLWEGMTYEDLERRYCRAGRMLSEDPCGVNAPEGDCLNTYSEQLVKAFGKAMGKYKPGSSVGVVVRPIALGVIRCALNDADIGQLWSMVTDRPSMEWYTVERNDERLGRPPRRATVAA